MTFINIKQRFNGYTRKLIALMHTTKKAIIKVAQENGIEDPMTTKKHIKYMKIINELKASYE